jgi:glycerophosphoryl diester phosphodiesterase
MHPVWQWGRFAVIGCIAAAFGAQVAATRPARSDWNVREHLPLARFVVQAHRGAGDLAPENTLEAFELGWKLGCVPEADLRTTRDGVIVAFHDNDFARVVRNVPPGLARKGVQDVTFAELSQLDVGAWRGEHFSGRRVSRMTDVFTALHKQAGRALYLDIKNVDLPQLAREIRAAQVGPQVILASTDDQLIRQWRKLMPDSQTLLWMRGSEVELTRRFEELRGHDFAGVTQLQIHVHLKGDAAVVTRDSIDPFQESDAFLIARGDEVRSHHILFQTLPYGGDSPQIYWKLMDLGFMSLASDHPDVTLKAVRQYYEMRP